MPAQANITVKKNDGTTDIVYTALAPSSGDGTPAIWKATSVGSAPSHQPELRLSAREASSGTKRALRATYSYPQIATNSTTSLTSVVDRASATVDWVFPKGMNQTDINEFVSQFGNLVAGAAVKGCILTGYSAT